MILSQFFGSAPFLQLNIYLFFRIDYDMHFFLFYTLTDKIKGQTTC